MAITLITMGIEGETAVSSLHSCPIDGPAAGNVVRMLYVYRKEIASKTRTIGKPRQYLVFLRIALFSAYRAFAFIAYLPRDEGLVLH